MERQPNRRIALSYAKDKFRANMLNNDTFFAIIVACMANDLVHIDRDMPDFGCEPTLVLNKQDGKYTWGLRFVSSFSGSGLGGESEVSRALYDYLPLVTIDPEIGDDKTLAPEFEKALVEAGVKPSVEKAMPVITSWENGWNEIVREFKDDIAVDPTTHTIALRADLK